MADTACGLVNDPYLPCSFNGVPFDALEVTSEHGRRGAEGEFPFGEVTAYADLGRRIRTYGLRGRLSGDGHIIQAAALIAACEMPGPGVLMHPTRGIVSAACRSLRVTDNIEDERGITYIDLELVEGNLWPNVLSLVGLVLGILVGGIVSAGQDDFNQRYRPMQTSVVRRPQVLGVASASIKQIHTEYQKAAVTTATDSDYRAMADLEFIANDDTMLTDTDTVSQAIANGINTFGQKLSGQAKFDAMKRIANFNAKISQNPDAIGAASEDAVYALNRIVAGAFMAQAAMEITPRRMDDAFRVIDTVDLVLTSEAVSARRRCANVLFMELTKFVDNTKRQLYTKAYQLPALIAFNFHGGVHSLNAAYSIFNDAKRHRELEEINLTDQTGRMRPIVFGATA